MSSLWLSLRRAAAKTIPFSAAPEWATLALLWLFYLALAVPYTPADPPRGLDVSPLARAWFDPAMRQPGIEHERLAGTLLPGFIGLERYGHIPAWNPYLGSGKPLINNPFSYLFNPFYSLPVLLLGGAQGSKLATALALLIAAISMWALARAVGLGVVGRLAAGGLYMMSGGLAGKFFIGHFQLGLSLAWVPLVFAGLWWTLHSRDRRAPVLMAAAFALLFTSGNIYYTLHTLLCCAAIFAVCAVEREAGRWRFQGWRLRRALVGGGLAVGFSALQFLPVLATAGFIIHDGDPALVSRYSLAQAAVNLIYPWDHWAIFEDPAYNLFVVVDYNHIGPAPFLLIVAAGLAALALRRRLRNPRLLWTALALALAMMVWGAGQTIIVQALYANVPLLAQFRFAGRALAIAALWWILLAAYAADALWSGLRAGRAFDAYDAARLRRALLAGALAWAVFLLYSAASTVERLRLALGDYRLLNQLDTLRFSTPLDMVSGFWACILAALAFDTLLLALGRLVPGAAARAWRWRGLQTRLLRCAVALAVVAALADVMQTNSRLLPLAPPLASFAPLHDEIRRADPQTPFPMVKEPFSPLAFETYSAELRNWGVSEGWRPGAPPGIIPAGAGALTDLPRWAIVSNIYGGASRQFAQDYVDSLGYERRACAALTPAPPGHDPCNLEVETPFGAALYELPGALPYAFVAPADTLLTMPGSLTAANVQPAVVLAHRQDEITIRAASLAGGESYLVVRETHFPGWRVFADGAPVESVTLATNQDPNRYEGFIGVRLLPGEHTYRLRFEPPGLAAGFVLFALALAAAAFYLLPRRALRPEARLEDAGNG